MKRIKTPTLCNVVLDFLNFVSILIKNKYFMIATNVEDTKS